MYCNQCGKQIPENGSFCPQCGRTVVRTEQDPVKRNKNRTIGIIAAAVLTAAVIALAAFIILKIRNSGTYVLVKYQDDEEEYCEMEYDSAGHKVIWQMGSSGTYIEEPGRFLWSVKQFDPTKTVNGVPPVVLYNMDDRNRSFLSYPLNEFLWENDIEEIEVIYRREYPEERHVYFPIYKDDKVSEIYYERNGFSAGYISYSYNMAGNLVKVIGKDQRNGLFSYSLDYDSKGRLSQLSHYTTVQHAPERETYSYNSQGNLESVISYDRNGDMLAKMQFTYNGKKIDKISVEGEEEYVEEYVFDFSGAPETICLRFGEDHEYAFDYSGAPETIR